MKIDDVVKIKDNFPLMSIRGKIGKIIEIDTEGPVHVYKIRPKEGVYLCFEEEIEKVEPGLDISKL